MSCYDRQVLFILKILHQELQMPKKPTSIYDECSYMASFQHNI